jgi:hydrogenase maturation protease
MTGVPRVLVGGVGYHWFGDGSFGLAVVDALARQELPHGVEVDDLGYGALLVAMDLLETQPAYDRVVLVAAVDRGREPGTLHTVPWDGTLPDTEEIQARVQEAGAGAVELDNVLVVAGHFGALPDDVVAVEFEPVDLTTGDRLSPEADAALPDALTLVRREAARPPLARRREADGTVVGRG